MNGNIGKNIKDLAQTCGWICLTAGILVAIALWVEGEGFGVGLIALVSGFVAFLGAFPLYGFGQLIDDVTTIRKNSESARSSVKGSNTSIDFNDLPDL